MRLGKTDAEALKSTIGPEAVMKVRNIVQQDQNVFGWAVFDTDGTVLAGQGVPETMTAVCSNVLDMACHVGTDLGEDAMVPTITFGKSGKGIQLVPLESANMLVVREKPARKEQ